MKYITSTLFSFIACCSVAQKANEEKFLVVPYLQFSTQTEISVLWETRELATSRVNFTEAKANVNTLVLDKNVSTNEKQLMHEVLINNLKPETNYFWQALSVTEAGDTIRSQVYSFKTAVNNNSAFMFALVGDSQHNNNTPWAWGKIAGLVWQDRPNFVLLAGDIVDQGHDKQDWLENYFPKARPLISRVPVYPAIGNHENDADLWYQYISAPAPEHYYTFTYGNAQFFMIDTNRDVKEGSEQYNWLEWELAHSNAMWKIAVHHHPPYSSDSDDHGNTSKELSTYGAEARNLIPLYERFGVDFCLFGHTHLYERTWPLKEDKINMKNGVVYINSGGAGGGIEDFAPTRNWFTQELQAIHHYCTFSVFENNISFKAIDHEGRLMDQFQMQKEKKDQDMAVVQPPLPRITTTGLVFQDQTTVTLDAPMDGLEIRYTLDGKEPTRTSTAYTQPIKILETSTLMAKTFTKEGKSSRTNSVSLRKIKPLPAIVNIRRPSPGLTLSYYEGDWKKLPDFSKLKPLKASITTTLDPAQWEHQKDHFGAVLEGYVDVPSGVRTFYLYADNGAKLFIDDVLVIDQNREEFNVRMTGHLLVSPGWHRIRIEYFDMTGNEFLQAGTIDEKMRSTPFTPFQLAH